MAYRFECNVFGYATRLRPGRGPVSPTRFSMAAAVALAATSLTAPAYANADLSAYVRARAADGDGRSRIAAAAYAEVLQAAPDNADVARRAYRKALEAGDDALVLKSLAVLDKAGKAPPDTAVFALTEAIRTRNASAQTALLARIDKSPLDFLSAPLRAWAALETGGDPIAILDAGKRNALTNRINAENRALLLIATGRIDEGVLALQTLLSSPTAGRDLRINAAQLLAGQRRQDLAQALLRGNDRVLAAFRAQADIAVKPTTAFGVSRLYTRIVADLVQGEEQAMPFSIVLSRAALRLEPRNDRARLLLADALSRGRTTDDALQVLGEIKPASAYYPAARAARVTVLARSGQSVAALEAARLLAVASDGDEDAAQRYGGLLVEAGRHADAARAFELAEKHAGKLADWILYLRLGSALDAAGRWEDARKALKTAVSMAPDEPMALNALAYALVEHREDMAAAQAMLERASVLAPDNASITDSLGWAYLQSGDIAKALPLLERAARAEPANAEISEHLGDAYWAVGRRYEARYAWGAAQIVADQKDVARITAKIADGMVETR